MFVQQLDKTGRRAEVESLSSREIQAKLEEIASIEEAAAAEEEEEEEEQLRRCPCDVSHCI